MNEIAESFHQFVAGQKLFGRPFAHADQHDRPGLAVSWAGIDYPLYNTVVLTDHFPDACLLQRRVCEAVGYMCARRVRGLCVLCREYLSEDVRDCLSSILAEAGLVPTMPVTGMVRDGPPIDAWRHPALRMQRIGDDRTVYDWAALKSASYRFPPAVACSLMRGRAFWNAGTFGYIAYDADGRPVSTATASVSDNCLYLSSVATAPDAQGRGYAEAVVRHTLRAAHDATDLSRTVLHTTTSGYRLYLRLGYHPTATFMACTIVSR